MRQESFDRILASLFGGRAIVVAVSGGVDSMCLAHLCLHSSLGIERMVVAHCNFHLRGEESDGDEALVRNWCAENGLEVRVADFDTASYAQEEGVSIEMAARELRYGWFAKLCREEVCDAVVVAHNANDNAETFFLNLLRGTGLRGACGMRPVSKVPKRNVRPNPEEGSDCEECNGEILLLRPLLNFSREEIEEFARENNITWREDRTNGQSEYKRNKLRNEVFPLLREINPSFVETLNRDMQYFSEAMKIVENSVPALVKDNEIDIKELLSYEHWEHFLHFLLRPYNFNSSTIGDIVAHVKKAYLDDSHTDGWGHIFLSPTHEIYTKAAGLSIRELDRTLSATSEETPRQILVPVAGAYRLGREAFSVEIIDKTEISDFKTAKGTTFLDADKVKFPLTIRRWRDGDWIRPLGMGGRRKKISDLFIDLKYNLEEKENALLLEGKGEGHILALIGERIEEGVKITSSSSKIVKIKLTY